VIAFAAMADAKPQTRMTVLVLNCGSSSVRFAVIDTSRRLERLSGRAQDLLSPRASIDWQIDGQKQAKDLHDATHDGAIRAIVDLLKAAGLVAELAGVGHRVVHGGPRIAGSVPITPGVVDEIRACSQLGPLHTPFNLRGIELAHALLPGLPQVAAFDTAFHQTMPPRAYLYAVPYEWFEKHGVRRYGFHGTSHRYVAQQAVRQLGLDPADHAIVTAHLGNGCSLAAVRDGRSLDTTMGLTPLDGVVMGTRCGSIDPSIVAHMSKALGTSAEDVMDALATRSGLLGLSGLSPDLRTLQEAADAGHHRAALAIEKFCHSAAKAAAGMFVSLGRVDAVVFTGGIGENAVRVRAKIVDLLGFAGFLLDDQANALHGKALRGRITRTTRPMAAVVATNEELMIAMDTAEIVGRGEQMIAA